MNRRYPLQSHLAYTPPFSQKTPRTVLNLSTQEKTLEAPQGNIKECPLLLIFSYHSCPLGEIMKFSINKTYNWKTWKVLNNQQSKYPTQGENRESSNFVFLFSQLCKNGHSLFFSLGALLIIKPEVRIIKLAAAEHHELPRRIAVK